MLLGPRRIVARAPRLIVPRMLSTQPSPAPCLEEAHAARPEPSQTPTMLDIGARRIFTADHDAFRHRCRQFFAEECPPEKHAEWEKAQMVPRELWKKAGDVGLLGVCMPEEFGGLGADVLYEAITWEELSYAKGSPSGPGFPLHTNIVMPYINNYGTEAQKYKYLPSMCAGETIGAIAMTEPGAGSDLQGIKTHATRNADGSWTLNGSKTYITNGYLSDVVIVVARCTCPCPAVPYPVYFCN